MTTGRTRDAEEKAAEAAKQKAVEDEMERRRSAAPVATRNGKIKVAPGATADPRAGGLILDEEWNRYREKKLDLGLEASFANFAAEKASKPQEQGETIANPLTPPIAAPENSAVKTE